MTNSDVRCAPDPNCPWCLGEGSVDSGGFTPWDTGIDVACGCTYYVTEWADVHRVRTDRAKSESSLVYRTRTQMPAL